MKSIYLNLVLSTIEQVKQTTSPPSPELDFPPNLFIAMAIASWVSLEIAPSDIPPVQNRSTMEAARSTFPNGIGGRSLLNSRRSRRTYNLKSKIWVNSQIVCYLKIKNTKWSQTYIHRSISQMLLINRKCTFTFLANSFVKQLWHLRVVSMIFPFQT